MKNTKNAIWTFNKDIDFEECGKGVKRKILSYTDEMMVVENHFEKASVPCIPIHIPRLPT